ncbi:GNAT family N-acetyltransferase [Actinomadura sp. ATCC 31491]|uniref:GNAT family N-acetyltransferase n=1 Tax=Actinomadura luzonensis TaxID=2805427 RepID=A0ABT0FVQ9_9ACTN|nr:GNAT family protein [Actinomadura luzonensis]MCK2216426.1 GNAT family N-acetyltransferase [Actinomadura luzonensis]
MLARDVISAGPLVLRPPADCDAEAVVRACDDPVTARFLPLLPSPYGLADARAYLDGARATWEGGGAEFAVTEDGQYVGSIAVRPPDRWAVTSIGFLVAPWARGKGVAATAARAVTDWLFDQGVRRVELETEVENVAGLRVAAKAGFREEGRRREAKRLRDGRPSDLVLFARLAGEAVPPPEPYLPFFEGGRLSDGVVLLTPMAVGDAADFHRMMTDPVVASYAMGPPSSLQDDERRCRYTGYWWVSGQRIELAVRDAATGVFAGHIQLVQVTPALGQAMVGYSLVPEFRGRGFMTRAVRLLVDWVFANTALHRVVAGTEAGNVPSHRVLERAGFSREGVHREMFPKPGGGRVDDIAWARVRPS